MPKIKKKFKNFNFRLRLRLYWIESKRESAITFKWVHRKSNLVLTLGNYKIKVKILKDKANTKPIDFNSYFLSKEKTTERAKHVLNCLEGATHCYEGDLEPGRVYFV